MKRIFTLIILCVVLFCSLCCISNADNTSYVEDLYLIDAAELLSDSEYIALNEKIIQVGDKHNIDIVILTVYGLEGYTAEAYADDFYDYCGYGRGNTNDGCLLLVDMESRQWHISTTGSCIQSINDKALDYISDEFLGDLKNGNYASAFTKFIDSVDYAVTCAENGTSVKNPFKITYLLIGLAIGLIVATVTVVRLYGQLKSVRSAATANAYLVDGSLALTAQRDIYLGTSVMKTPKPKNNSGSSTHTGSSGTSHGGSGGSLVSGKIKIPKKAKKDDPH